MVSFFWQQCTMAQALNKFGIKDFAKKKYLRSHFLGYELFQIENIWEQYFVSFTFFQIFSTSWLSTQGKDIAPLTIAASNVAPFDHLLKLEILAIFCFHYILRTMNLKTVGDELNGHKKIQLPNLQISQQRSSDRWQIFLYFKCKIDNEGLPR